MTTIRPLMPPDLPLIQSWMQDSREAPAWSDDDLQRLADRPQSGHHRERKCWVAMSEAIPAGFIVATALHLADSPAECEIEFVMTSSSYRRKGVARALVSRAVTWARELAAEEVWLEVRASNEAAQRLYRSCGFKDVGLRAGYYSAPTEDAVLMRRWIGSKSRFGLV